jgi:hypothetical protein
MKQPKLCLVLAFAAVAALQFVTPTSAHADTYSIVGNWAENTWGFQGINPSGNVYLDNFYSSNYETEILSPNGSSTITYSNSPLTFVQDRAVPVRNHSPGSHTSSTESATGTSLPFFMLRTEVRTPASIGIPGQELRSLSLRPMKATSLR